MNRPCLTCGEPTPGSYCTEHDPGQWHHAEASARARGYDTAWARLSKRVRRLQPFCTLCGATANLQADHLPSAWERKAAGKPIRLRDVRVLCGRCNVDAGSSRPKHLARQGARARRVTAGKGESQLHMGTVPDHVGGV